MRLRIFLISLLASLIITAYPQNNKVTISESDSVEGYKFTTVVNLKSTPVKNQASTGTCWCFATTSFIESELLRTGKGEYDLSEMFIVRQNYLNKLTDNYLRLGKGNLGEGSLSHHWMTVFAEQGIVPDEIYRGLNYGSPLHNHSELNAFINAVAAVPVEKKNESYEYHKIVNSILDTYLGTVPASFTYKDKTYTPKSFAAESGINPADYVEITSFTHFPFFTKGQLEIPDNWDHATFYNVPIDELIETIDYSLSNGYTVNWDGDISEDGFANSKGIAIYPEISSLNNYPKADRSGFEKMTKQERSDEVYKFLKPYPEVTVTQKMRQTGYENFTTTDDHQMHITGIAKDQDGTKYYITKNSWGTGKNEIGGYLNMSESYARAKTIFIMVNKNAVPPEIKEKLGL
jgi:hypothetical protein